MSNSPYTRTPKIVYSFKRNEMLSLYAELPDDKQEAFRMEYPTGADNTTVDKMIDRLKELKHGT